MIIKERRCTFPPVQYGKFVKKSHSSNDYKIECMPEYIYNPKIGNNYTILESDCVNGKWQTDDLNNLMEVSKGNLCVVEDCACLNGGYCDRKRTKYCTCPVNATGHLCEYLGDYTCTTDLTMIPFEHGKYRDS